MRLLHNFAILTTGKVSQLDLYFRGLVCFLEATIDSIHRLTLYSIHFFRNFDFVFSLKLSFIPLPVILVIGFTFVCLHVTFCNGIQFIILLSS